MGVDKVYDGEIYERSDCYNVRFIVMWSCYQGQKIDGMPLAWLHTADLSEDGYMNPWGTACFIGFKEGCPYLVEKISNIEEAGKKFCIRFYYYAFQQDVMISQALDLASKDVFGVTFAECPFYKGFYLDGYYIKMVVYGCTNYMLCKLGVYGGGGGPNRPR